MYSPISRMRLLRILKVLQSTPCTLPCLLIKRRSEVKPLIFLELSARLDTIYLRQCLLVRPLRLHACESSSDPLRPVLLQLPGHNVCASLVDAVGKSGQPGCIAGIALRCCRALTVRVGAGSMVVTRASERCAGEDVSTGEGAIGIVHCRCQWLWHRLIGKKFAHS